MTIEHSVELQMSSSSKSKSKKSKKSKDTTAIDIVVDGEKPVGAEIGDDLGEKHSKEKKDKKQKRKAESGDVADESNDKPVKEKKKKRKAEDTSPSDSTPAETGAADEPMDIDVPAATSESKAEKKKKRKRDQETEQEAKTTSASEPSEKKKKKRKSEPSTEVADEIPAESSKSPKKEKKDKKEKKGNSAPSTSAAIPAPSSSTASPEEVSAFLEQHSISIHSASSFTPVLSFDHLNIPDDLRSALDGFKEPTPIQACSWPAALEGKDVVGIAETGSGKTLAFGLPALARLVSTPYNTNKPLVLVLAPTRELAIQTHDTLADLGTPFGIRSVALFGGVDKAGQIKALQTSKKSSKSGGDKALTRIIVGTPGRILDLVNDGICDLSEVRYLVLDEADRMLDKGFENDIRNIIGYTKQGEERQTLMFSATWPDAVRRLASTFQRDPVRVTVGSEELTANSRVEQSVEVFDDARTKDSRLLGLLNKLTPKSSKGTSGEVTRILVFALYKKEAARVEGMLRSKGYSAGGLHGDLSQNARMDALQKFKTGTTPVLVATDVAARGLDIPNVAAVINYTFPLTIEDYIHRIGRTGRGGKSGKSITFFTGDNHERSLAGELARVLRESGFEAEGLKKFPMTIKKKTHSAYGAFFRDDIPTPSAPTKITFD